MQHFKDVYSFQDSSCVRIMKQLFSSLATWWGHKFWCLRWSDKSLISGMKCCYFCCWRQTRTLTWETTFCCLYDSLGKAMDQTRPNFFLIVHGSPLNLAKDPSATSHPQSGMIQDSPPPPIPLSAVFRHTFLHFRHTFLHSLPVLPTCDCWCLRFKLQCYCCLLYALQITILTSKQPIPSPPPLSCLNLTTVTHYTTTYLILS